MVQQHLSSNSVLAPLMVNTCNSSYPNIMQKGSTVHTIIVTTTTPCQ